MIVLVHKINLLLPTNEFFTLRMHRNLFDEIMTKTFNWLINVDRYALHTASVYNKH